MTHLKVKMVNGRYDLCDWFDDIDIPQKSFWNNCDKLFDPMTSSFVQMAGISSWTKSPSSEFINNDILIIKSNKRKYFTQYNVSQMISFIFMILLDVHLIIVTYSYRLQLNTDDRR